MHLNTYLNFNGQCEAAFKFYERVLGGKITSLAAYDTTPAGQQVPADWRKKIVHAEMKIGEALLMGADAPADRYQPPQGFSVTIQTDRPAEADRLFEALAESGQVRMPIQQTFWAARFGMLVDHSEYPGWSVVLKRQPRRAGDFAGLRGNRRNVVGNPGDSRLTA
jgi:PhnB protein